MSKKQKTIWLNPGWLPFQFAFCGSEKAWQKTIKKLNDDAPFPTHCGGRTVILETQSSLTIIVYAAQKENFLEFTGVIAHEAVHVWQTVCEYIGEENPSPEFEAYSIQRIFQALMEGAMLFYGIKAEFIKEKQ